MFAAGDPFGLATVARCTPFNRNCVEHQILSHAVLAIEMMIWVAVGGRRHLLTIVSRDRPAPIRLRHQSLVSEAMPQQSMAGFPRVPFAH